jgi:hypothetical protein
MIQFQVTLIPAEITSKKYNIDGSDTPPSCKVTAYKVTVDEEGNDSKLEVRIGLKPKTHQEAEVLKGFLQEVRKKNQSITLDLDSIPRQNDGKVFSTNVSIDDVNLFMKKNTKQSSH